MEMRKQEELHDIVIIGGAISGLATALGLHKNTVAAVVFFLNGWHAFDHLGVGDQLRAKSTNITEKQNEDAVVLARCLSQEMSTGPLESKMSDQEIQMKAAVALRRYARERRWRILLLSAKSYLLGSMLSASWLKRFIFLIIFSKILGGKFSHTKYDCGQL